MNWTVWIRQAHRWISVVFIAAVLVATFAALSGQDADSMLYYLPLPPLFALMATGLFMFVRPYLKSRRVAGGKV